MSSRLLPCRGVKLCRKAAPKNKKAVSVGSWWLVAEWLCFGTMSICRTDGRFLGQEKVKKILNIEWRGHCRAPSSMRQTLRLHNAAQTLASSNYQPQWEQFPDNNHTAKQSERVTRLDQTFNNLLSVLLRTWHLGPKHVSNAAVAKLHKSRLKHSVLLLVFFKWTMSCLKTARKCHTMWLIAQF